MLLFFLASASRRADAANKECAYSYYSHPLNGTGYQGGNGSNGK